MRSTDWPGLRLVRTGAKCSGNWQHPWTSGAARSGQAVGFSYRAGGGTPGATPQSHAEKLNEATALLKRARGEEARKKALTKLSSVVNAIFDEDLKRRESEVDDIRERVRKLKALIDKRKDSKDRIVELQFRIQVNEVAGLGFSVRQKSRRRSMDAYSRGMSSMAAMMGGFPASTPYGEEDGSAFAGAGSLTMDPRQKAERNLRSVLEKLKNAKTDKDRQTAAKDLKSALDIYFSADLKVREQEIGGIQKRVENLDKLIDRRRKAREEIISLQLELLTDEADGLGFSARAHPAQLDSTMGEGQRSDQEPAWRRCDRAVSEVQRPGVNRIAIQKICAAKTGDRS